MWSQLAGEKNEMNEKGENGRKKSRLSSTPSTSVCNAYMANLIKFLFSYYFLEVNQDRAMVRVEMH